MYINPESSCVFITMLGEIRLDDLLTTGIWLCARIILLFWRLLQRLRGCSQRDRKLTLAAPLPYALHCVWPVSRTPAYYYYCFRLYNIPTGRYYVYRYDYVIMFFFILSVYFRGVRIRTLW